MEHPAFTLSALCGIGAIAAYSRKGSVPSLIAGGALAVVFGASGYLLKQNADWGLELALAGSATLLAAGSVRAVKAPKKAIPFTLVVLGGVSTAYYVQKYNQFYPFY